MINYKNFSILLFFLFGALTLNAQQVDNLSKINQLVDKSINDFLNQAEIKDGYFLVNLPQNLKILTSRAELNFEKNGLTEQPDSISAKMLVKYNVEFAGVRYNDLFRDGLFGDYFLEREVFLKGYSFVINKTDSNSTSEFNLSVVDTINYENLKVFENPSLPFTQGDPPAEPFISGALEPIIAIGTVVVTLLLFFTVRSK